TVDEELRIVLLEHRACYTDTGRRRRGFLGDLVHGRRGAKGRMMPKISKRAKSGQAVSALRLSARPGAQRKGRVRAPPAPNGLPGEQSLAAIDVGTNAVRLEMVRPQPIGSLEILHQERDPLRPGEGVFRTGYIPREVADRLMSTL